VAGADGTTSLPVEEAARAGLFALSPLRYVERTREPLLVEDAVRDDRFARDPYFAARSQCALLVLPILSQGQLRAVLLLENHLARAAFSAHRLDAVKLIAGQLAVSLDNALLYASLERKVAERTEALGAANRRRFDTALESEWVRARRSQLPLAVAMIDIDQFKLYNDHYGHPAGDLCIQRVAQALAGCVRAEVDLLARYGGEEFALVLPGADLATGRAAAERAGLAVAELRLPHERATHGLITVSIGVAAVWPGPELTAGELLRSADEALYRAKRGGRNRVEG
jgi:diguanylate cyclase (GGDEF)-like protein